MLEFTEKLGIYAVATQMGKGVLPDPNPNPNPDPNPNPNPDQEEKMVVSTGVGNHQMMSCQFMRWTQVRVRVSVRVRG